MVDLVNTKKIEKPVLIGCFVLLLFMVCDTYIFPYETHMEFVDRKIAHKHTMRKGSFYTYEVITNKRSFDVYSNLYNSISYNDTVVVKLSRITKSLLSVAVKSLSYKEFKNGYITTFKGSVFVPLLLATIIPSLLLFNRFPSPPGRRNLIIMIAILTLAQLYYYLRN